MRAPRRWLPAVLAGLATIGAYGLAQYAFGVLIVPIADSEGWSAGQLSAAFSVGLLLAGPVAVGSGQALDRLGSRPVLLGALVCGSALLAASSFARSASVFILLWGGGSACIGGGLFYPMTMAVLTRTYAPEERTKAFSVLTLIGALASPAYYPLAGGLVEAMDWREAVRVLVACSVVLTLPAALLLRTEPSLRGRTSSVPLAQALRDPSVWRFFLAVALSLGAVNALHLHQVAALHEAGLTVATASLVAGLRGFLQIPGRLFLSPLVARLGMFGSLGLSYGLLTLGAATLLVALVAEAGGVLGVPFAIATGLAVGLLSPLHGLIAAETYGVERLGTLSGAQQLVASVAGAGAAWSTGLVLDATGSYEAGISGIAVAFALGIGALVWQRRALVGTREQMPFDGSV